MEVVISGTGLFTPRESISNVELVESFNAYVDSFNIDNQKEIAEGKLDALTHSNVEFIEKASGIKTRYVLNKSGILDIQRMKPKLKSRNNEELSVLAEIAILAGQEAIKDANLDNKNIDAVICGCANLQRAYPAVAIEIQKGLDIDGYAYDMNVACSSATFAIQNAVNDIISGVATRVLVVNPEICTGHLNFRDKDAHFIFGDASTAIVLEKKELSKAENIYQILGTKLKTKFSNNIRNNFGFLNIPEDSNPEDSDKLFKQNGRSVFKEVVPLVESMIKEHLEEVKIPIEQVSRFWLHQANQNMNELIAKRLLNHDINQDKMPIILDEYANTSSAGSIIAFHKYNKDLNQGSIGVICSFGAGYSVGSIIVKKIV